VRIERERRIAGHGEVVHRKGVQHLSSLDLGGRCTLGTELGETVGDVEDKDDERAVRGALDLKIAEERVGTEQVERFVYYIVLRWIPDGCRAANACSERQNGKVSDLARIWRLVESRVRLTGMVDGISKVTLCA